MHSEERKIGAYALLGINGVLYFVVIAIATWAANDGINRSHKTASVLSLPARVFPIYYPFGNRATGFLVIFTLIAGVVGFTTSITGIINVRQWDTPHLHAAAASMLISWFLTLPTMGLAWKEIEVGHRPSNLRALEGILIILSVSQLICTNFIYLGLDNVTTEDEE